MYKVYVKVDAQSRITAVDNSAFITDTTGWIQIDEGDGDRFQHAQGNYFPLSLTTEERKYRYKLSDGQAVERTTEEIAADAATLPTLTPAPQEDAEELLIEHEYRITLLEMGVSA